jgi:hypothetical protein
MSPVWERAGGDGDAGVPNQVRLVLIVPGPEPSVTVPTDGVSLTDRASGL